MIEIITENTDYIVVYKPEGVSFHNDEDDKTGFFNQVKNQIKGELFSVHRLDKVTSGLIIFAKTQEAASIFGEMFREHTINKFYIAIASNKTKKKQGLVKGDMAKSRRGTWMLLNTSTNPALTQFFSYSLVPGQRLFLLRPLSGKTHQIRVALKSLRAPILGDINYAGDRSDRVYLHAYCLNFEYKGQSVNILSNPKTGINFLKDEVVKVLKDIKNPKDLNWPKVP